MTISALLGHLASRGEKTVNATTLMVAVLDNIGRLATRSLCNA